MAVNYVATTQIVHDLLRLYISRTGSLSTPKQTDLSNDDTPKTPKSFCFVALSSLLAVKGGLGAAAYAASKAALVAYTRALALEARYGNAYDTMPFRANVVLPGYIETPMLAGQSISSLSHVCTLPTRRHLLTLSLYPDFSEAHVRSLEKAIPLGRFGRPEEVADAVIFLIANEYANNTVLNLDGGLSAT